MEVLLVAAHKDMVNGVVQTVERALDLPVRWETGQPGDVVRIELGWTQLGMEMCLRCVAADEPWMVDFPRAMSLKPDWAQSLRERMDASAGGPPSSKGFARRVAFRLNDPAAQPKRCGLESTALPRSPDSAEFR